MPNRVKACWRSNANRSEATLNSRYGLPEAEYMQPSQLISTRRNSARYLLLHFQAQGGKNLSFAPLPINPNASSQTHTGFLERWIFLPKRTVALGRATVEVIRSRFIAQAGKCLAIIALKSSMITGSVLVNRGESAVSPPSA